MELNMDKTKKKLEYGQDKLVHDFFFFKWQWCTREGNNLGLVSNAIDGEIKPFLDFLFWFYTLNLLSNIFLSQIKDMTLLAQCGLRFNMRIC
jgi:hypothetical protein